MFGAPRECGASGQLPLLPPLSVALLVLIRPKRMWGPGAVAPVAPPLSGPACANTNLIIINFAIFFFHLL